MPCIKCANGKWKYGEHGNCQFDTLKACKDAAAAIHIQNPDKEETMAKKPKKPEGISTPAGPHQAPNHPYMSEGMNPMPAIFNPCVDGPRPDNIGEDIHYMLEEHWKSQ